MLPVPLALLITTPVTIAFAGRITVELEAVADTVTLAVAATLAIKKGTAIFIDPADAVRV
jgi:hypothetical protein